MRLLEGCWFWGGGEGGEGGVAGAHSMEEQQKTTTEKEKGFF